MTDYNAARSEAMASHAKRAHMYGGDAKAYASGGGVHDDEKQDRALIKTMLAKEEKKETKRADGGEVMGRARGGKADRPRHGSKTVVNVVAPQAPAMPPRPVPVPVPVKPPMAGMPPGAGMGSPPGAPPPGGPPGMPMRARGGRADGGATGQMDQDDRNRLVTGGESFRPMRHVTPPQTDDKVPVRAGGGKIDAGAMSGLGRLEKAAGGIKGPMIERK